MSLQNLTQVRRSRSCVVKTTGTISLPLSILRSNPADLEGILPLAIRLIDTDGLPRARSYLPRRFVNRNGFKVFIVIVVDRL